jgi:hypothetical protein
MSANIETRELNTLDDFRNEMRLLTRDLNLTPTGPTVEELEQQGFSLKITGSFSSRKHEESYFLLKKGGSIALIHEVYIEREGGLNFRHYYGDEALARKWSRKYT